MTSSSGPFTYSSKFSSSDERISTSPIPSPSLSASITGSARRTSTTGAARYLPHRHPRASARRPRRRHSTSTSSVDVCRLLNHHFKFQTRRAQTRARKPRSRPRVRARVARRVFCGLDVNFTRRRPVSRREARATILRAQDDLYQEFSGTYQKPLVLHCLLIQNDWYASTLVRKKLYQVLQAYRGNERANDPDRRARKERQKPARKTTHRFHNAHVHRPPTCAATYPWSVTSFTSVI